MMKRQPVQPVSTDSIEAKSKSMKAVVAANFRVIYQPISMFPTLYRHFERQGLQVQETEHFLCASNHTDDVIILVHTFYTQDLDNNVGYYLMKEVAPLGLVQSEKAFGAALVGIVISTNLDEPLSAWGYFSVNTLQQIKGEIRKSNSQEKRQDFITSFAAIYQRLLALKVGSELLDVGCACAFWPVLVAQTSNEMPQRIVGVDNRQDAINLSTQLASLTNTRSVDFLLADVLAPNFSEVGPFDTVTAIHLLEHIPEHQLPHILRNLLQVTRHRLLIAVPYEEHPELAYGHEQVFNREKLEVWGDWCVRHLHENGKAYCEDVQGGLLVIERFSN